MSDRHCDVIVVGGGIGGLTLAAGLQRRGVDAHVYERAPALAEVGAGLTLWANALYALDKLGLREHLPPIRERNLEGAIRDWRGRVLMAASAGELNDRYGEANIAVHRAELQQSLYRAVAPGTVHLGMPCTGFEEEGAGVTARLENGDSVRGRLLVGADGIHSAIRTQLHGDQPTRYAGYTAWRGIADFDYARLEPGETWGRGTRFGSVPIGNGRVYWFATANAPAGAKSPEGEKQRLRTLFGNWHAPISELIEATPATAILRNDIRDRKPIAQWGRGRATLLGDAAHATTPNMGQGACQAIEDAEALVHYLTGGSGGSGDTVALRAYEHERARRTAMIVNQSWRIGSVAQWSNPVAVALRNRIVRSIAGRMQERQLAPVVGYRPPGRS